MKLGYLPYGVVKRVAVGGEGPRRTGPYGACVSTTWRVCREKVSTEVGRNREDLKHLVRVSSLRKVTEHNY